MTNSFSRDVGFWSALKLFAIKTKVSEAKHNCDPLLMDGYVRTLMYKHIISLLRLICFALD